MHSDRHEKVSNLILQLAANFIQQEANTDPLITLTRASVSPDYKKLTLFFTTIPDDKEEDARIFLKRSAGELRHFVKKTSNLKIIPHIEFEVDYGERHRQHIDEISREIKSEE